MVVALVVRHCAGVYRQPWLRVMHVANQVKQSLGSIVLGAVGGQRVSLSDAVRDNPAAPKAVLVSDGVLPQPRPGSRTIGKLEIAAARNVLGCRGGRKQH